MTLFEIVAKHPDMFYRQDWWHNEPFAHADGPGDTAAFIAAQYLADPDNPKWERPIWTDDYDSHGNRVYVGGVGQNGCDGFQIHRHLVPDERWVEWRDL